MKTVELFTDGACSGNPGCGGWAYILRWNTYIKEQSGAEKSTTNNRMELTAVIEGLSALKQKCQVELYSDSKYVCDSLSKGWAKSWRANNWRKSDKKPALNAELWERLLELCEIHEVNINWVKGHAGHPENEKCDQMAVEAIKQLKNSTK